MTPASFRVLAFAAVLLLAIPAYAQNALEPFVGTYVGSGIGEREGEPDEQRDMDVTIEPYKNEGFTLKWITVIRGPSGERAGADVKRRQIEEQFLPSEEMGGIYIRAPQGTLFKKAELPNPLRGEPMRWASIHGQTMTVYSLGITAEGGSELQIYHRTLTPNGMDANFLRMQDEQVKLRVTGNLVRTE